MSKIDKIPKTARIKLEIISKLKVIPDIKINEKRNIKRLTALIKRMFSRERIETLKDSKITPTIYHA